MNFLDRTAATVMALALAIGCSGSSRTTDGGTDIGGDGSHTDATPLADARSDSGLADVAMDAVTDVAADSGEDVVNDTGPTCTTHAQVLMVASVDWLLAAQAFAATNLPCADYWISVAPQAGDATMLRGSIEPSSIRDVSAHTHALAVFDWAAWSATNPTDWNATGISFRRLFDATAYNAVDGDTWLVVNVPVSTLATSTGRQSLEDLVTALYNGPMGSTTLQGGVVLSGPSQTDTSANIATYHTQAEAMLTDTTFWTTMGTSVRWLGEAVPPDPAGTCVAGSALSNLAAFINAYTENLPRLAAAMGAPTTAVTALNYLNRAYVPILSAQWDPSTFPAASMTGLVDTEVYATLTWAAGHSYPGERVGFGWAPPAAGTSADESTVLNGLAASVAAGYVQGTVPATAACVPMAPAGCGCTASGASFAPGWSSDDTW